MALIGCLRRIPHVASKDGQKRCAPNLSGALSYAVRGLHQRLARNSKEVEVPYLGQQLYALWAMRSLAEHLESLVSTVLASSTKLKSK